jgi:hypothetical protein
MRDVKVVTGRRAATALMLSAALVACSRSENSTTDSAAGNVGAAGTSIDTGMNNAATPVAGGTAQITPTDAKSVTQATEYKLTDENFRQFVAASDSLVALRRRDPAVRALFDKEVSDAGVNTQVETMNAGRKRLEDNPVIAQAIESTGMSAKDYFVASIAVAQAERFMGNPKSAPPADAAGERGVPAEASGRARSAPHARARRLRARRGVGGHQRAATAGHRHAEAIARTASAYARRGRPADISPDALARVMSQGSVIVSAPTPPFSTTMCRPVAVNRIAPPPLTSALRRIRPGERSWMWTSASVTSAVIEPNDDRRSVSASGVGSALPTPTRAGPFV